MRERNIRIVNGERDVESASGRSLLSRIVVVTVFVTITMPRPQANEQTNTANSPESHRYYISLYTLKCDI